MSIMIAHPDHGKIDAENVDLREQLFNGREAGPIQRVQLPTDLITALYGISFDFDPGLYRNDAPLIVAGSGPKEIYKGAVGTWLLRSPPAIRDWLVALLLRGEGANNGEEESMHGLKNHHAAEELATRYNAPLWLIRQIVQKLGIGHRFGRFRVMALADLPRIEAALEARGYPVAARSTS